MNSNVRDSLRTFLASDSTGVLKTLSHSTQYTLFSHCDEFSLFITLLKLPSPLISHSSQLITGRGHVPVLSVGNL